MPQQQITIRDIARQLNISVSTVSRALKDHPDISDSTKKAVVRLAKELDYQPNSIALSLRKSKTFTIGVIIPELVHYFFSLVISGIEDVAYAQGYNVVVCQSNESYEREVSDTQALYASRVDGFIVSVSKATSNFDHFINLKNKGIPIVFFDRIIPALNTSTVIVDDKKGARDATLHLLDQGCQRIAHLAGPPSLIISQNRIHGYLEGLDARGVEKTDHYIVVADSRQLAFDKTLELLDGPDPPDAFLAVNDLAAIGAMAAIKEKGLRIPEDVAVVGFSDWELSSYVDPPLSSVMQPGYEMGRLAALLFLREINHKNGIFEPIHEELRTELVVRKSSLRRGEA